MTTKPAVKDEGLSAEELKQFESYRTTARNRLSAVPENLLRKVIAAARKGIEAREQYAKGVEDAAQVCDRSYDTDTAYANKYDDEDGRRSECYAHRAKQLASMIRRLTPPVSHKGEGECTCRNVVAGPDFDGDKDILGPARNPTCPVHTQAPRKEGAEEDEGRLAPGEPCYTDGVVPEVRSRDGLNCEPADTPERELQNGLKPSPSSTEPIEGLVDENWLKDREADLRQPMGMSSTDSRTRLAEAIRLIRRQNEALKRLQEEQDALVRHEQSVRDNGYSGHAEMIADNAILKADRDRLAQQVERLREALNSIEHLLDPSLAAFPQFRKAYAVARAALNREG